MRSLGQFFLLIPLLCSVCFGQIDVTVTKHRSIAGLVNPRLVGGEVQYDEGSKPVDSWGASVKVSTPAKFVDVIARRFVIVDGVVKIETADAVERSDAPRTYSISGVGAYLVEVIAFDPTNGISRRNVEVMLSDPNPAPDPDEPDVPVPDDKVPTDSFDNVGQRVAKWSAGLPKRKEVAAVYRKWGEALLSDPRVLLENAMVAAASDRVAVLGADAAKYNDIVDKVNADIKLRWPMSKGTVGDYFLALAAGYGGGK